MGGGGRGGGGGGGEGRWGGGGEGRWGGGGGVGQGLIGWDCLSRSIETCRSRDWGVRGHPRKLKKTQKNNNSFLAILMNPV